MEKTSRICEADSGEHGLIFPLFESEQHWDRRLRAVLYAMAMLYLFLGVNIAADKFMAAIEMIRSKKLRVRVKETGKSVTVTMWNPTVANLTLMALGSSAPEILLSVVELIRNRFYEGALGPSTIIGSAAFNLFVIVGVCIMSVPSTEVRRIKEMGVFFVTMIFSVFSYLWMLFIVQVNTKNVIELWEAVVTVALLPILIFISYLADIGLLSGRTISGIRHDAEPEKVDIGRANKVVNYASVDSPNKARPQFRDDGEIINYADGTPIDNPSGVLTFDADAKEFVQQGDIQEVKILVFRRNGTQGTVACSFSMEPLTAMPDYDYKHSEGELRWGPGQVQAEIMVELLPKHPGEKSDSFQIVLSDAEGGVIFDPNSDGAKTDRCILTVMIRNGRESNEVEMGMSMSQRALSLVDGTINLDRLRLGSVTWYDDIMDAIFNVGGDEDDEKGGEGKEGESPDGGGPSKLDWTMHIVSVPWKFVYAALVPPPIYCGGWICFTFALFHIAALTAFIIDFAELFGCVCGIEDFITAITFVALGTSMPDLFASITAAAQDEWADASIINVTGSNSVNVFLGIGLPWTMASIYWAVVGPTDEWKALYGADFLDAWPNGGFILRGDNLTFSVGVFCFAACICLALILLRRWRLGGELGGPFGFKLASFLLQVGLWIFYIGLSVWKSWTDTDIGSQVVAICVALAILENAIVLIGLLAYGICRWARRVPTEEDPDEDIEELPTPEKNPGKPCGPRSPAPQPPSPLVLPPDSCFEQP